MGFLSGLVAPTLTMLFTDRIFVTVADMAFYHGKAQNVATDAGIKLTGSGGLIERTIHECGAILLSRLHSYTGSIVGPGASGAHMAVVLNVGGSSGSQRLKLAQIVLEHKDIGISPVKDWVAAVCVRNLFRGAIGRGQDDTRFHNLFLMNNNEARQRLTNLATYRLQAVNSPLLAPAATGIPGTGSIVAANISTTAADGTWPAGSYFVAVTLVSEDYVSPTDKNNSESASHLALTKTVVLNDSLTVDISNLVPNPSGESLPVSFRNMPKRTADRWMIYASTNEDELRLQAGPTALTTTSLRVPAFDAAGAILDSGQYGEGFVPIPNRFSRA